MKGRRGKPTREPEKTISKSVLKAARVKLHGGHFGGDTPAPRADKRARGGGNWIKGAIKHPGALDKALHVPEGEKIPAAKLQKAAHSKNPTMWRRAALAKTLKKMH